MPVMTLYRHGQKAGIPPKMNSHKRTKRGECEGWTLRSTRSNTEFLYSVDERELTGEGMALTLTLRDCPPTHDDWHRLRNALVRRLRRLGMIRMHWLTEWQARGVPHLHAAVWFESSNVDLVSAVRRHWVELAAPWGAAPQGQHLTAITDSVGWFKYLSKHAVRGVGHYQRSAENIPRGWQKTGRVWGRLGEWVTQDGIRVQVSDSAFYAYRRIVRNWRYADARAKGERRRMRSARKMLQAKDENLSRVRGVSEWINLETSLAIVAHLGAMGYEVSC